MADREPIPPPPGPPPVGSDPWLLQVQRWLEKVYRRIDAALAIAWQQIDTAGSKVSDLGDHSHDSLTENGGTGSHDAIAAHVAATSAHGATGDLVGNLDLATGAVAGVVRQASALADLNLTASNPPTQAEVQAVSDKVDALLAKLRTAGILDT